MKKQHFMAGLGILLALLVVGIISYRERYMWDRTFISVGFEDYPKTCPVHKVETQSEHIANHHMTVSYKFDYSKAQKELFPLSTINTVYGHPDERYTHILRKFCPSCREARKRWFQEQAEGGAHQPATRPEF